VALLDVVRDSQVGAPAHNTVHDMTPYPQGDHTTLEGIVPADKDAPRISEDGRSIYRPLKSSHSAQSLQRGKDGNSGPDSDGSDIWEIKQSKTPSLIFEYVNNTDFRSLYPKFVDFDVRYYIFELLKVCLIELRNIRRQIIILVRLWISAIARA
jgi:hypothetical protein